MDNILGKRLSKVMIGSKIFGSSFRFCTLNWKELFYHIFCSPNIGSTVKITVIKVRYRNAWFGKKPVKCIVTMETDWQKNLDSNFLFYDLIKVLACVELTGQYCLQWQNWFLVIIFSQEASKLVFLLFP